MRATAIIVTLHFLECHINIDEGKALCKQPRILSVVLAFNIWNVAVQVPTLLYMHKN